MTWYAYAAMAAVQVIQGVSQAQSARQAGDYNAKLQTSMAYDTLRATASHEELQRTMADQDLAKQRAALSANGIDPTSGSALVGTTQSMRDAELDALMIRYEGVLNARNQFLGANVTKAEGRNAQKQGYLSAAGQALNAYGGYIGRTPRAQTTTPTISRPFDAGYDSQGMYFGSGP
jgi:hypothetical protein